MPALNTPDFVTTLQQSQFLTGPQLDELNKDLSKRFREPKALAQELLRRTWLTPYQAKYLIQGRGGHLIIGPFRIIDKLREIPLGKVYKARHVHMNRVVTLLVLAKERRGDAKLLQQLTRAASQLAHPNVVQAFDVGQAGEINYMATEFFEGSDLGQLVQKHGPVPAVLATDFIRQAAQGLQHAHEKGVMHGDINPEHLLVTSAIPGGPPQIKVSGFGSGRLELGISLSPTGGLVPQANRPEAVDFLSPEQAKDPQTTDPRSDIFSLGCTLFYILSGRPPFQGTSVMDRTLVRVMEDAPSILQVRPDVPPGVAAVLAGMLARDVNQRIQSAGEVVNALGQALAPVAQAPIAPVAPLAAAPLAPAQWEQPSSDWAGAALAPAPAGFAFQQAPAPAQYDAVPLDHGADNGPALVSFKPARRRPQSSKAPLAIAITLGVVLLAGAGVGIAILMNKPEEQSAQPTSNSNNQVALTPTPTRPNPRPDTGPAPATTGRITPTPLPMPPDPPPMPPMPPMPPEMMPAQGEKLPVPDEAEATKALALIQDLYKAQYAKTTSADRLALSAMLHQKAQESADDKTARFMLLKEAADLAVKGGDPAAALEILDEQAGEYAVNGLELKAAALEATIPSLFTVPAFQGLISGLLAVIDEAVAAEDLAQAEKLLVLAENAVPKATSLALAASVKSHRADLDSLQKELEKIKPAKEKLEKNGDDPEANEALGRFYCFVKNDFEKGLLFLTQAKDEKLKEIANLDLAGTMEAPEQAKIGDAWWDLADKEEGPAKLAMLKRSFTWYQQAVPGLSGLELTRVEGRVKELTTKIPGVRGRWDHLDISEAKALTDFLRIEGTAKRVATKQGYGQPIDIIVTARTAKNLQIAAFGGTLTFNWDGPKKELTITRPDTGKAVGKIPLRAQSGTPWHTFRWQITEKSLRVYLDNRLVYQDRMSYALSGEEPVRVLAMDGMVEIKTLSVVPVKK